MIRVRLGGRGIRQKPSLVPSVLRSPGRPDYGTMLRFISGLLPFGGRWTCRKQRGAASEAPGRSLLITYLPLEYLTVRPTPSSRHMSPEGRCVPQAAPPCGEGRPSLNTSPGPRSMWINMLIEKLPGELCPTLAFPPNAFGIYYTCVMRLPFILGITLN